MKRSETIGDLANALAYFHATVTNPRNEKTADTGKYTYTYVDFATLLDTDRTLLAAQGLSVVQELVVTPGIVGAATTILHKSGEWLELEPAFIPAGDSAQDYGAAASYSRRYSYMAALDLAGADDGATLPQTKPKSAGPGAASDAQQKKIAIEAKEAGLEGELKTVLAKRYKVDSTKELTKAQASDLIERLIAEKERRAAAAAAGADPVTGEVHEPAVDADDDTTDYWPDSEEPVPGDDAQGARARWDANEAAPAAPEEGRLT